MATNGADLIIDASRLSTERIAPFLNSWMTDSIFVSISIFP